MAQSYRGRKPENVRPFQDADCPWCTWLRCAHCRVVTLHAVIADSLTQRWRTAGCDRERHNRLTDRCRRRIERRLAALAAEGVTVVRVMSTDDMQIDDAHLEVVEHDDTRGLQIGVCATTTPELRPYGQTAHQRDSTGRLALVAAELAGVERELRAASTLVEAFDSEPSLRTIPDGLDGEHQRWAADRVARQETAAREAKEHWQRQQETRRTEPSPVHWSTPDRGHGIGR